jgi:hypothetical protein
MPAVTLAQLRAAAPNDNPTIIAAIAATSRAVFAKCEITNLDRVWGFLSTCFVAVLVGAQAAIDSTRHTSWQDVDVPGDIDGNGFFNTARTDQTGGRSGATRAALCPRRRRDSRFHPGGGPSPRPPVRLCPRRPPAATRRLVRAHRRRVQADLQLNCSAISSYIR